MRHLTPAEHGYIERNYPCYNTKAIGEQLNMTDKEVRDYACRHGIEKTNKGSFLKPPVFRGKVSKPKVAYKACDDYSYKPLGTPIVMDEAACYEHIPNPKSSDYVNSNRPKRPNLFQRIIGFLLRGDW